MSLPAAPLCPVSLGCVTFGREIAAPAAHAMMDHALARGVNLFDTAAAYAAGASETIVGEWLRRRRPAGLTVATKVPPPFTAGAISAQVRGSRARLGRERLDVLFAHKWDDSLADDEALHTLDRFVRDGEVAELGVSNVDARQLALLLGRQRELGLAPFRWLQNNHNYAVRDVDGALRALCAEAGITVITYSPLGAGFLTGKHRAGAVPAGSRFALIPGHQRVYFQPEAFGRLARLEEAARRTGRTQVELALLWALQEPGTASVLVGGRNPDQLDQAFAARQLPASLLAGWGDA